MTTTRQAEDRGPRRAGDYGAHAEVAVFRSRFSGCQRRTRVRDPGRRRPGPSRLTSLAGWLAPPTPAPPPRSPRSASRLWLAGWLVLPPVLLVRRLCTPYRPSLLSPRDITGDKREGPVESVHQPASQPEARQSQASQRREPGEPGAGWWDPERAEPASQPETSAETERENGQRERSQPAGPDLRRRERIDRELGSSPRRTAGRRTGSARHRAESRTPRARLPSATVLDEGPVRGGGVEVTHRPGVGGGGGGHSFEGAEGKPGDRRYGWGSRRKGDLVQNSTQRGRS
jgi:hypothetical protein